MLPDLTSPHPRVPLYYHLPFLPSPSTSSPNTPTSTPAESWLPYLVCRELVAEHTLALVAPEVNQHLHWGHVELALYSPRAAPLRDSALGCEQYALLSNCVFVFRIACFTFKELAS